MNNKKQQQGFTIIELMIAISVIAVAMGLIFKYWGPTRDSSAANQLMQNVTLFHGLANDSCINGDCSNVSSANLVASGIMREFHNSGGTDILSTSGSAVVFGSADVGTGSDNGLSQTHADIKQRVCNLAAKRSWDSMSLININGVSVKTTPSQSMDETAINTNCTAALNSIEFIIQS